jgi:glycosyltransferase involved in cell wall biosynthesis
LAFVTPEISVVLPVYNAARYLGAAIQSILEQDRCDFELLVIDDGSEDGSLQIARGFEHDPRVRVIPQPWRGLVAVLNLGTAEARGEFIARMDADDISVPGRLARQVAFLHSNPSIAAVGSAVQLIDAEGAVVGRLIPRLSAAEIREALLSGSALFHPTVMLRRQALVDIGGYRAAFVAAEDYDLWLRLSEQAELANVSDVLLHYRVHEEQVSSRKACQQILSRLAAQLSAAARRQGQPDPAASSTAFDIRTLLAMGGSETGIEHSIQQFAFEHADRQRSLGGMPAAESLLREMVNMLHEQSGRDAASHLNWSAARWISRHGEHRRAAIWALQACWTRPRYALKFATLVFRRMGRRDCATR